MKVYREDTTIKLQHTAIALGKFDGLHKGHQLLLRAVLEQKAQGLTPTVFTFDVSPVKITTGSYDGMLLAPAERQQYLEQLGIAVVIEYPFTYEFSRMEPEAFVRDILIGQLDMRYLTVGEDFHFGRNQTGDVALLQTLSGQYGFALQVFRKLSQENEILGATGIKALVRQGEMQKAAHQMGHPYQISGFVTSGNQLGRKLSFPTANLPVPTDKVIPPHGVYAVLLQIEETTYEGIANLGSKPTVSDTQTVGLETFIFDFDEDLYGKKITVYLLHFLRPEQKFDTVAALKEQIARDVSLAKAFLASDHTC